MMFLSKTSCEYTDCSLVSGSVSSAQSHVPIGKSTMEDSFSPYNLMSSSESPTSTLVSPESWTQGKSPNEKMSSNSNINWPPGKLQCILCTLIMVIYIFFIMCMRWHSD